MMNRKCLNIIMGLVVAAQTVTFMSQLNAKPSPQIKHMIIQEAENSGVPIPLALAVARIESNFNPHAESHKGARGIMQIMPKTAQNVFGVNKEELWNARLNIQLGLDYLEQLYHQYGKNWDLALSHYNGGTLKGRAGGEIRPHTYTRKYLASVKKWWAYYSDQAKVWDYSSINKNKDKWIPARTRVTKSKRLNFSPYNSSQLRYLLSGSELEVTAKCTPQGKAGHIRVQFNQDQTLKAFQSCRNSSGQSYNASVSGTWVAKGPKLCLSYTKGPQIENPYSRKFLGMMFRDISDCWTIKRGEFGLEAFNLSGWKDWSANVIFHPHHAKQENLYASLDIMTPPKKPSYIVAKKRSKSSSWNNDRKFAMVNLEYNREHADFNSKLFFERLRAARNSLDDFGPENKTWFW